jgi:hypothetical protein
VVRTLGVETIAVDHGVLRGNAEHARSRVTILWQRSSSTDLDDGRAKIEQGIGDIGVLVKTGRDTDGVGEGVSEDLNKDILTLARSVTVGIAIPR